MANRIQIRRDNESNWNNVNPILADGELALTYDNNKIKIGDGSSYWSDLSYATGLPSLATVATSGSYNDLTNTPSIPASVTDLIGSSIGYSASNNRQFLRFNSGTSAIEFSSDFRVVPFSSVAYPNGTLNQDKVGDVAFSAGAIYYCVQEPNSYTLTWVDPSGWASGIIELSNRGPNNEVLSLGSKLTDGNQVVTVTELITGGWDGTRQVVRLSTEISAWRSGTGTLTVLTSGTKANTHIWARFGTEVVAVPTHYNSNGILGQVAYDSNYMYRCTQSSQVQISAIYHTPKYIDGSYTAQGGLSTIYIVNDGVIAIPQVGWTIFDGNYTKTITSVNPNSGQSGQIWIVGFSGGDIDWSAVTSLTFISQQAAEGIWKRIAFSSDTW